MKDKPINVNDLSNQHFNTALNAISQVEREGPKDTVASRHLIGIAIKQWQISDALDGILKASEKAAK